MRPFFSYYGAKYTAAKHLGAPRRDLVIEPFAGSAAYSTRWGVRNVHLYDVSADICDLWDFLINSSSADIAAIPDQFEDIEQVMQLDRGPQLLCCYWLAKGRVKPTRKIPPWYFDWRRKTNCHVWSEAVKKRVIAQKPMISNWSIDQMSWEKIPVIDAHWHVDPPYNNEAGSKYPHSEIDYKALGEWCRDLPGSVDVCENLGADWMDFNHLCDVVSSRGRRNGAVSKEAVWRDTEFTPTPKEQDHG